MNIKSLSDAQLVSNYILGEEVALSVLKNRHQARLYGFIFSKIQFRHLNLKLVVHIYWKLIILMPTTQSYIGSNIH